jgi:hypothetical protein
VEIESGLQAGDQVIYAGDEMLREGDPVVPTAWGPSGPLALPPATGEAAAGTVYTCPMHPDVKMDKPGDCPKCGMKLVPVKTGVRDSEERAQGGSGVRNDGATMPGMPGMGGSR